MSADILEPKPAAPRRRVHGKKERGGRRRGVVDDCDEKRRIQINIFSFTLLAAAEEAESNCACGASERASPSSATETVSTKSIIRHGKTSALVATRRQLSFPRSKMALSSGAPCLCSVCLSALLI